MVLNRLLRGGLSGAILRWGAGLRFPYLFLLTAGIFFADLIIPDMIPLADELIFGLVTLLLASLKKKFQPEDATDNASKENTDG